MARHHKNGLLEIPEKTEIIIYPNPPVKEKEEYKKSKEVLFPAPPEITDVIQGPIGDCYLLATLISIINTKKGAEYIEGMMKDDETHIIVRMYNDKMKACYFKIEKSYVYMKMTTARKRADGPLWVTLIEKAFLVFMYADKKVDDLKDKDYYKDLLGGGQAPDTAMKVLLGKDAESLEAQDQGFEQLIKLFNTKIPNFSNPEQIKNLAPDKAVMKIVFDNKEDLIVTWTKWACTVDRIYSLIMNYTSKALYQLDHFNAWFEQQLKEDKLDQYVVIAVKKYIMGEGILSGVLAGKRGTGIYNKHMMDLYNKIQTALAKNLPAAVHSKGGIGGSNKSKKGNSGEDSWKGLFTDHAYAVLSVRDEPFRNNSKVSLKMIQLRNPHGKEGRDYIWKEKNGVQVLSAKETKDGTFWLELSDLTKRFKGVYVGKEAEEILESKEEDV